MRVIELSEPHVSEGEVSFAWTVRPSTELYTSTSFGLSFPADVNLGEVPPGLWWRIALLCLHGHWPLLRPCRIVLPVTLPAGEKEFWLRLLDAAVASLESFVDGEDTERGIEIVGSGPQLEPLAQSADPATGGVISCFSGGRDGITQAAMLSEIGEPPTLVTVTSPVSWSNEHETPRRREVLSQITARRGLELVEVRSDLRASWRNEFALTRYGIGVNEVSDTFLYLAAALVVGAARGARLVLMASENEVQENAKVGGMVVQMQHFMYSAATHQALSALLGPAGILVGSTTYSLRQFQVQRLLAERYGDLRDLQYSCWSLEREQSACSRCSECRGIALNLISRDVSPSVAGIDLVELLLAQADWQPGQHLIALRHRADLSPREHSRLAHEMQELRCLVAAAPERVAKLANGNHPPDRRQQAMITYERIRDQALSHELEPEPGYRPGYLEFLPEALRPAIRSILEQHFVQTAPEEYARRLANTRLLADWISAPLGRPHVPAGRSGPRAPAAPRAAIRPATLVAPEATALTDAELALLGTSLPAPEPELVRPAGGRLLHVAETLLDGNELAYVRECVSSNWISSAGPFVGRLERAFADAMGCAHALTCSSGTAALHLALSAAGVGAGDEVIVPAFTMIATANAVRYTGAQPVFVDADPQSWNLDPSLITDKLSRRTRAIVAVHTYGQPADMDALQRLARDNALVLIEDAAEAHGASYRGRPVGSIGAVSAFSLYGNKILTSGEGGMVSTNDPGIAGVARELRDHAFSAERHFWHRRLGFNYRMTNLQAAIGLAQTERLDELVSRRRSNSERYVKQLSGIRGITLPPQLPGGVSWMFGITVGPSSGVSRDELRRRLAARGVQTRTFFVPLHLQPIYFRQYARQRYPVAEELGAAGLYLPSGPALSDDDVTYIAEAIRASVS